MSNTTPPPIPGSTSNPNSNIGAGSAPVSEPKGNNPPPSDIGPYPGDNVVEHEQVHQIVQKEPKDIRPILVTELKFAEHSYRTFDVSVSHELTREDLEDPMLWTHVGMKLQMGNEVRVVADDYSFVAYLFVTFVQGSDIRCKVISFAQMDAVTNEDFNRNTNDYEVKIMGLKKWCIIKRSTGEVKKENIPSQREAYQELDDLLRALAA